MQTVVGKRAESVANPGVTDGEISNLGYFERQTDDWGDAFVLRNQEIETTPTVTYVTVDEPLTKPSNDNVYPTVMYVTVGSRALSNDGFSVSSYGEIDTLYKKKKDKVRPVNKPHKQGLKLEGIENWKEQIVVNKNSNKVDPKYPDRKSVV